jgi:VWFA-related protein
MVQVDAVVRDRAGHMIDNLTADDFRVYEDGVLQEVQNFSRDELPLAVAIVIDRSGSVSPYISELRRIATRALDQLKHRDEVCLFSFADTVDRLEDLTTNRQRIVDAIDRIRTGGGTDITDALHDAVTYLARIAPDHRHAVILISDNQQTVNPQASETETIQTATETETVVYSLKTSGDSLQLASQLPSLILRGNPVSKITQETGGEIISVNGVSSLDSALGSVISRLRMRYSLGYYPSGTAQGGAFHAIKVRLTDSHGKAGSDYFIHAKRGYYATGSSSASTTASYFSAPGTRLPAE